MQQGEIIAYNIIGKTETRAEIITYLHVGTYVIMLGTYTYPAIALLLIPQQFSRL